MKILGLGKKENYDNTFIFEISKEELEKLLGTYYARKIPGIDKQVSALSPGDEIDISLIYAMTKELIDVSDKMMKTIDSFKKAQESLISFAEIVVNYKEK